MASGFCTCALRAVCVLVCLFWVMPASAQTTGKIAGTITDASTGESLPGVNVLIEGTAQGTATDLDGRFVIIGVRPGTYTIVASFIGFATQRQEGVQVNVDLTTTVDFVMREEVFEGEEVVVIAEAVRVRKDLTSSEARVTAETIDRLPVQELGQVLNVQAGITERDGLHIRGGRSSEVVVMVDGVPVTDTYDGSTAIQLENEGIQELQVISGTFNAEYGNAMSGVINVVTKEGRRDRFGGTFEAYSGSYLVPGDGGEELLRGTDADEFTSEGGFPYSQADVYSYLPVEPLHYNNLSASLEGPLFTDRLTFFVFGRYFNNDGWLYGANIYNIDGTFGDSTLVPMNTFEKVSWQGNLKYQLANNMFINLISVGSQSTGTPFSHAWRWAPAGLGEDFDFGNDLKLKFTHLLSATTFYTLNFATFFRQAEHYLYDDLNDPRYNDFLSNTPDSLEVMPGVFEEVLRGGNRFLRGGTDPFRLDRITRSYFMKGDLTSQVTQHHLLKVGFEARLDQLSFEGFALIPSIDENGQVVEPYQPAIPPSESIFLQRFDDVDPITVSAYVQDKIEYENFIVNAGVRLDYFDSRAQVPADPEDPNIFNPFKKINRFRDLNGDGIITDEEERDDNQLTQADREAYWWEDAEAKFQVSPRLGVAYPITEEGVIHFSWGHFLQIPTLNRLFDNFGYKVPRESGQYGPFGNPDLSAQRTVMYEIGLKQAIGDFVIDVTAYNRDVRSWVSTSRLIETEIPGVTYVVFANRDYANTRGVTLSLSRAFTNNWGFDLNYTYQVVEGSNSNPDEEFFASQSNEEPRLTLLALGWDQRHKVAGSLYVGGSGWGASLLGVWGSGFPYTPSFPEAAIFGSDVPPEFPTNSRRQPNSFQVDIDAYKEFTFGRLRPRVFVQIFNLFNAQNALNVYGDTGEPDITFSAPIISADPGFFMQPNFFSEPRRAHLGVRFRF